MLDAKRNVKSFLNFLLILNPPFVCLTFVGSTLTRMRENVHPSFGVGVEQELTISRHWLNVKLFVPNICLLRIFSLFQIQAVAASLKVCRHANPL